MNACTFLVLGCCNLVASLPLSAQSQPASLADKIRRFVPVTIAADTSTLSGADRAALGKLIEAAKLMDSIYLRQVWSGNPALLNRLREDASPEGRERLHYFVINTGPWSRLDGDAPFIDGVPNPKPPGANYYPPDIRKEEISSWLDSERNDSVRKEISGFYYTIHRDRGGRLFPVPYSEEYKEFLIPAAKLLREAAALTTDPSLRSFLNKRADAFLSNDYYASDVAWLSLDGPIEPTIGPYEVYMDELFNYKAAFEAFIGIRDDAETRKLARFSAHLQEIEDHLPIDPGYRNPRLGALSPIRVVDLVVTGGEARPGVQTAAFNLPNDERIIREKGSKRVMLKNVQEAKFNNILKPIASIVLPPDQQGLVSFEPFFTHILAHELMHGLGPHEITVAGKKTSVRQEMKDLSSSLEEAKADIAGLFALQFLIDRGVVEKTMERQMYVTYLAGAFRSVRFGANDAHGQANAVQFNYITEQGGFRYDKANGTYSVNFDRIKEAVKELTGRIMTLQVRGDYDGAKALLETYGTVRPNMQATLDKLSHVPVDIEPAYPLAE